MSVIKVLSRSAAVVGVLLLCACQSLPPAVSPVEDAGSELPATDQPAGESAPSPVDQAPARRPAEQRGPDRNSSVVMALEAQARQHIVERDWHRAIAAAEHGLRINRRYAAFYQILAEGYRALENYQQAAQFARQGLRFCGNSCAEIEALLDTIGAH